MRDCLGCCTTFSEKCLSNEFRRKKGVHAVHSGLERLSLGGGGHCLVLLLHRRERRAVGAVIAGHCDEFERKALLPSACLISATCKRIPPGTANDKRYWRECCDAALLRNWHRRGAPVNNKGKGETGKRSSWARRRKMRTAACVGDERLFQAHGTENAHRTQAAAGPDARTHSMHRHHSV